MIGAKPRHRGRGIVTTVVLVFLAAACTSSSEAAAGKPSGRITGRITGSITVSAASSLGAVFDRIVTDFERAHPGTSVHLNLGPSSSLARQIEQGTPADVLAAADDVTVRRLERAGLTRGKPKTLARNEMVIVTKPGNPQRVRTVRDLEDAGVVALCAAEVPCGQYAAQVLTRSGARLDDDQITRQVDASATIGAVSHGDADAAIVYLTDAKAAGRRVAMVAIPVDVNVVARYPIVTLRSRTNPDATAAFVDAVLSPAGQATLRRFGFRAP